MGTDTPIWEAYPLLTTMWKTKNSRFHAAYRLRSRGGWKGIALSILSAYVLVISVVPKFIQLNGEPANKDYLGLFVIAASIIILVFSVMSMYDDDKLRSNYMHDNAKEIGKLYHAYKLGIESAARDGGAPPDSDLANEKYQAALERCPFNHDPIDWLKTSIDLSADEGKWEVVNILKLFVWLFYDIYFWPILAMTIPWVAAYLLLTHL